MGTGSESQRGYEADLNLSEEIMIEQREGQSGQLVIGEEEPSEGIAPVRCEAMEVIQETGEIRGRQLILGEVELLELWGQGPINSWSLMSGEQREKGRERETGHERSRRAGRLTSPKTD
jgi:hypothetical protein